MGMLKTLCQLYTESAENLVSHMVVQMVSRLMGVASCDDLQLAPRESTKAAIPTSTDNTTGHQRHAMAKALHRTLYTASEGGILAALAVVEKLLQVGVRDAMRDGEHLNGWGLAFLSPHGVQEALEALSKVEPRDKVRGRGG